jgi:tRNA 2-thiouridine synthesizing protein D
MKYAIQVNAGYTRSSLPLTACRFIQAALDAGHEVPRVFFYHDGVYNGFDSPQNPAARIWSALAEVQGIDLVLCVTACSNRGLTPESGLLPGFRTGGLGLWMEAQIEADRFVVF